MYNSNPIINLIIWVLTGFGFFGKKYKYSRSILDSTQNDLIHANQAHERLKAQLETLQMSLANDKQRHSLEMELLKSRWSMERDSERSLFDTEKKQWEMKNLFEIDQTKKRIELASEETLVLKKLEYEQKTKQFEINKEREVLAIKEDFAEKKSKLHQDLHAEMYGKLSDALVKMSAEGDKNTQFVHKLMLNIFDKAPALNSLHLRQSYGELPAQRVEVENS